MTLTTPRGARQAARDAATSVLPALMGDMARGDTPLLRLCREALKLAADEALDAAAQVIADAERERIRLLAVEHNARYMCDRKDQCLGGLHKFADLLGATDE